MSRLILTFFILAAVLASEAATADDWSRFRGPDGSGASAAKGLALTWEDGKNVLWEAKLPGRGASSIILVGKRAFVTCYSGYGLDRNKPGEKSGLKLHLVCYDARKGSKLWDQSVDSTENVQGYGRFVALHGYASSTPASDGLSVYTYFGPNGVLAYDLEGKLLWRKKLGKKTHVFGTANSPVLYENLVIVNAGVESGSLVGLDKKSGKVAWEASGMKSSWNTPSLVKAESGRIELIVNTKGKLRAYDPKTGAELWTCSAINDYICPSIISHAGTIYAIGGRSATAVAVRSYEVGIAELADGRGSVLFATAPEVTACEAAKDCRATGVRTFALERIEDLFYCVHSTPVISNRVLDPRHFETLQSQMACIALPARFTVHRQVAGAGQ